MDSVKARYLSGSGVGDRHQSTFSIRAQSIMTSREFDVLLYLLRPILGDGLQLDGNILETGENGRIPGDLLATSLDPSRFLIEALETALPTRRLSRARQKAIHPTAALRLLHV